LFVFFLMQKELRNRQISLSFLAEIQWFSRRRY